MYINSAGDSRLWWQIAKLIQAFVAKYLKNISTNSSNQGVLSRFMLQTEPGVDAETLCDMLQITQDVLNNRQVRTAANSKELDL